MSMLTKNEAGQWALATGKHAGKELTQVAQEDPGYLGWMWLEPKVYDFLPDDAAWALDDTMCAFGISQKKQKKRRGVL